MIENYILQRPNLFCTIVLIDARLELQANDLDFITWMGEKSIPMAIALTKTDKLKQAELAIHRKKIEARLLERWEELPPMFVTSAEKKSGRDRMLEFMEDAMKNNQID
jgi:GTP-binding protein